MNSYGKLIYTVYKNKKCVPAVKEMEKVCTKCGARLDDGAETCAVCGEKNPAPGLWARASIILGFAGLIAVVAALIIVAVITVRSMLGIM